ncbi:MAG: YggT family protein [Chloroflexi bacterium]|nr:YggT family protein [Chloroflexota bacterium]
MSGLARAIDLVANLFMWIVIANVLLSYFLPPYHSVRQALDQIVEPFLAPIRRLMPNTGMIDFSPMVLILLIQVLSRILISLF